MLNAHLRYKPLSSWRILFWYGGRPWQFSRLKIFNSVVVPGRECCKGVIIQCVMVPTGVLPNGQSYLRIKGDVSGSSVHAPMQRNINYGQTVRRSIYKTRGPEHPHLTICWYRLLPQGPALRTRYRGHDPGLIYEQRYFLS